MLSLGGLVSPRDFDGWTPLHAAVHWGQTEACELLIDAMVGFFPFFSWLFLRGRRDTFAITSKIILLLLIDAMVGAFWLFFKFFKIFVKFILFCFLGRSYIYGNSRDPRLSEFPLLHSFQICMVCLKALNHFRFEGFLKVFINFRDIAIF